MLAGLRIGDGMENRCLAADSVNNPSPRVNVGAPVEQQFNACSFPELHRDMQKRCPAQIDSSTGLLKIVRRVERLAKPCRIFIQNGGKPLNIAVKDCRESLISPYPGERVCCTARHRFDPPGQLRPIFTAIVLRKLMLRLRKFQRRSLPEPTPGLLAQIFEAWVDRQFQPWR